MVDFVFLPFFHVFYYFLPFLPMKKSVVGFGSWKKVSFTSDCEMNHEKKQIPRDFAIFAEKKVL